MLSSAVMFVWSQVTSPCSPSTSLMVRVGKYFNNLWIIFWSGISSSIRANQRRHEAECPVKQPANPIPACGKQLSLHCRHTNYIKSNIVVNMFVDSDVYDPKCLVFALFSYFDKIFTLVTAYRERAMLWGSGDSEAGVWSLEQFCGSLSSEQRTRETPVTITLQSTPDTPTWSEITWNNTKVLIKPTLDIINNSCFSYWWLRFEDDVRTLW